MKKISLFILSGLMLVAMSCSESEFAARYADPSKVSTTTIEKQYTGFLGSNMDYILPKYRNYFVSLRTSVNRYTQATGWANDAGQYVPGSSGIEDVWFNYYNTLAQYRALERVFATATATEQTDKRIFMLTATIHLYDYTQRLIDLHGGIPFLKAGMLLTNGGDYDASSAPFDSAETLYVMMLDQLKGMSTELNGITLNAGYQQSFKTQDFINKGNLTAWKRYCNSLRLKMLNRVSAVQSLTARANTEMAEILRDPTTYPIVETNDQNIQINIFNVNTAINIDDFQGGLEGNGWYGNTAGKRMIDNMNTNADPRLPIIFEPGENAGGKYTGIDPLGANADQSLQTSTGLIAIYNRYTISRNKFLPGTIYNAAQMNLIKSEYYLRSGNAASAKTAYESAISNSVKFYNGFLALSNATGVTAPAAATDAQITAYIAKDGVNWDKAETSADKLSLIATQKWLHSNIIQAYENWAEIRRLDLPVLNFVKDASNNQTVPPVRWNYPSNEITYNKINYDAVRANDNLTTKLFWDVK
ncbi:SusD/RagB family nutrient-binding outer membrane lipoprotein [Dyadobacter sp. LHD-138]|uniref:SusD/RagB family nutrient-binding outer membrane lipoprotein n=1 Tax=Dyadobacter sp. LHD-138 TaxID=3071413 RepID=UPI0027DF0DDF|nr:SusD/RagB family nutrient-binding outer membrane lipoprotein [Dyadobacter sp. LHD-138]MDQ6477670.1 SusD/RagB family nutrient-binding outer membrane lipoprotein [Dyadobacter sp. LHD-138]